MKMMKEMLKTQYTSAMEKYEFDDHWSEKK
jgi:hypothetical protein